MFWNKIISLLFFMTIGYTQANAQFGFDIDRDETTGQIIFVGRCTFDDLADEASFDWLRMGSDGYNPDAAKIDSLKKILPTCQLVIFMGTWCEDTQNLLPKLYKTMLYSHCYTNYKMYAVNRNKISKNNEQEPFKVVTVPTIIVQKNGVEIGRIVETTKVSIEDDLLKIVVGKQPK